MLVKPPCPLPNSKTLRKFYFFEYQVFRAILQIELNLCKIYYSGMPFGQIMYDGGTLKNKQKYQTVASKHLCFFSPRISEIVPDGLVRAGARVGAYSSQFIEASIFAVRRLHKRCSKCSDWTVW